MLKFVMFDCFYFFRMFSNVFHTFAQYRVEIVSFGLEPYGFKHFVMFVSKPVHVHSMLHCFVTKQ